MEGSAFIVRQGEFHRAPVGQPERQLRPPMLQLADIDVKQQAELLRQIVDTVGDKQDCTYPGCKAKTVLKECRMAASSLPKVVTAGAPFSTTDRLEVWFCEMNPRRHVEVRTWGTRPVKDCSVAGCRGIMVHSDKLDTRVDDERCHIFAGVAADRQDGALLIARLEDTHPRWHAFGNLLQLPYVR